ncbi:MAG: hypothetical protein K1X75_10725 [Leptospirales bacterium]|nr:hypothetical protein [Leptospirales bacterium]
MFEGSSEQDSERSTRGGYLIKIKPSRKSCIVYADGTPEKAGSGAGQSIEQPIPFVAFIGPNFQPTLPAGKIDLAECRRGRLAIPYRIAGRPDLRALSITCNSRSDQFPVQVQQYPTVRQFLGREGEGHPYRYIVVDPDLPRLDLVTLKVKNPEARILILKAEERPAPQVAAEIDQHKVRATDLVSSGNAAGELTANPVFNARVHLRNLHLAKVRQLLMESVMSVQELEFIRTFLAIMIRNDQGKAELASVGEELRALDELYRLAGLVLNADGDSLSEVLDGPLRDQVRSSLLDFVAARRRKATDKEEELQLWEWEYRLKSA